MSDNFALTVLSKRREQVLANRGDSERDLEHGEELMANARQAIARADEQLADLDRAISALTPVAEEPGGGGGGIDAAPTSDAPYADSCILKTTQEDAGLMFGAGKGEDYPDLTAEQTAAIERATADYQSTDGSQIVSGEPWDAAKGDDELNLIDYALDLSPPQTSPPAGYQHVVDAEPAPVLRADVPADATTFTAPSGELFATFNGQTHLVLNDPPAEQSEPYSAAHEADEDQAKEGAAEAGKLRYMMGFDRPEDNHFSDPELSAIAQKAWDDAQAASIGPVASKPLTLDQMDDQGITDPNASAMLRMMTARKLEGVS